MSSASRQSWAPGRRARASSGREASRSRRFSRAYNFTVEHEEARSHALRAAYLHYLLQPKAKRKQYVAAPKPAARSSTSVGQLIQEYGSGSTSSLKLPHNFASPLLDRLGGILRGGERLPGFTDAAVKRSFAEAYTAFSDKNFIKTIDKERKIEPLVLIFYSSATKAAQKGSGPDDDSWKLLPDRHLALFVRLAAAILRDLGHERDRPELLSRLKNLEKKLLTNDQNLVGNGADGAGTTIEVVVPLSYDVKDMPMVQVVASIFGMSFSEVQTEINEHKSVWTEKAALKDLKAYQLRLNSGSGGTLTSHDFDVEEAFEDWKKSEAPHLSQMLMDILIANPELSKTSTGPVEKPLPSRPQSTFDDQAYAELGRALANGDDESIGSFGFDASLGLNALSLSEGNSIRSVDENLYTFIPPDPRAFMKYITQHAMAYDQIHADPQQDYQPLSKQSLELLTELCVRWRVPQSSRLIALLEVASRKFLDQEIVPEELDTVFDFIKTPLPEVKKAPHMSNWATPLSEIPPSRWTIHDFAAYQHTMATVHDSLLRELFVLLDKCYDTKPPNIGAVMFILENHIHSDPIFSPSTAATDEFSNQLSQTLSQRAADVYRQYMQKEIPAYKEDWEFGHVVKLGKSVTKLCDRIRKRYKNTPEIMGVNPLSILVHEVFPSFEEDANAIIQSIMQNAQAREAAIDIEDGFDLYRELVAIRNIHRESLPERPFAFDIENLLVNFVWRWIEATSSRMLDLVDGAIKQDNFQVRGDNPTMASDDQRHSVSIIDLFMLFNQSVEQVCKLEWDNDEHYARFMTALAGSFSEGIGRYCETVEQRFTKEMDRPTAEEIAAQNMTTQEKWMQYAKDAWMAKEKPEPFHFYPESFVKLNNIEYAMQELDRLEKSMNVEQCAEIMEKFEAPKKKTRKPNKYTFTVKIVEAEDLKACDPNGFSDPYVVFGDEYQKRLHKTRIIYRNLNPRWDESFDVTVQSSVNVIATVWDYDTFGDHDFVGRTSLKLDPVHFSDYLPREFWLDLDTQGRVLVRVSMEGERDDIRFHFAKAFRHLRRTEKEMVRKITDKLTAQINVTLSRETLRHILGTGGIGASVTSLWKKRTSTLPTAPSVTRDQIDKVISPLFEYFDANFAIMKQTLTDATMLAVMTRLWKEVLMAIENLLVPPLSEKPSLQRQLTPKELDIVYSWLEMLFAFFNARDEHTGEQLGVPAEVLKSPKWHELASLNFFYFQDTNDLIRESERMAAATAHRAQQALHHQQHAHRASAPPALGGAPGIGGLGAFASMGTIRRGKSIMMSRNLGTMRKAKEDKRREAQADPSDDMILRILRMRPEAVTYLKERHRQKERQAATAAAAQIVKNSVNQGWAPGGQFGRNNLPRR